MLKDIKDVNKVENTVLNNEIGHCQLSIAFYEEAIANCPTSQLFKEMYDLYNNHYKKLMQIKKRVNKQMKNEKLINDLAFEIMHTENLNEIYDLANCIYLSTTGETKPENTEKRNYVFYYELYDGVKNSIRTNLTLDGLQTMCSKYDNDPDIIWWDFSSIGNSKINKRCVQK